MSIILCFVIIAIGVLVHSLSENDQGFARIGTTAIAGGIALMALCFVFEYRQIMKMWPLV